MRIPEETYALIEEKTANGEKYLHWFDVDILDEEGMSSPMCAARCTTGASRNKQRVRRAVRDCRRWLVQLNYRWYFPEILAPRLPGILKPF